MFYISRQFAKNTKLLAKLARMEIFNFLFILTKDETQNMNRKEQAERNVLG